MLWVIFFSGLWIIFKDTIPPARKPPENPKTRINLLWKQPHNKISLERWHLVKNEPDLYGSILYNSNVSTNIGKSFLTILDRHFPKSHKLYKIFNQNNVKISYSSLPNYGRIINSHNKKIINNNIPKLSPPTCNCRSKTSCPLNGGCLQTSLVYICKADTPNITQNYPYYVGLIENKFKDRFFKHKNSFKYESKLDATELSNFVWENKHANTETNLVWNILDEARTYKPEAKRCLLCLIKKYHIIFSKLNLLNWRNELVTNCRHENKFYLPNFEDSIT